MIPHSRYSKAAFANRFPPRGRPQSPTAIAHAKGRPLEILNDVPPAATSCLVYDSEELHKYKADSTYPIPATDEFNQHRQLQSLEAVFKKVSKNDCVFSHMFVSPEDVLKLFKEDFMTELLNVQKDLTGRGRQYKTPFEKYAQLKPNRDGQSSYTIAGTVQTNPPILSPVAHSTNERASEELRKLLSSLNLRMATLGSKCVNDLFPRETSRLQALRQTVLNAPLFGSPNNHSFSTMQVNISPLNKTDLSSLGYSGMTHTDKHDDPFSLSLLICISHLASDTDPGNFYIGETREWCKLRPFSLLIFRGLGPHAGTQAIPRAKPKDWEKRINLILYPRREFVNRENKIQYPCYEKERLADYSFFFDGEACFGTEGYHRAWCTKELFRHFLVQNQEHGRPLEDSDIQKVYRIITGSDEGYIGPDSKQGKGIRARVAEANDLLHTIRPILKEVEVPMPETNQRVEKPLAYKSRIEKQTQRDKRNPKTPGVKPNTLPSTSATTNGPATQKKTRGRVAKTRSKESADGQRTRPTLMRGAKKIDRYQAGVDKGTAAKFGAPSANKFSDEGDLLDDSVSGTNSENTRSYNHSPRSDILDDTFDRTHSATETYLDGETPSDNTSSDGETAPRDDTGIATTGIDRRYKSSTIEEFAAILKTIPLFDVSPLKDELSSLRTTATLLPSKFRGRIPQTVFTPDFRRVPSALPLPRTAGVTIVEEMIQLGETCCWITQKNEHIWLFKRALYEGFCMSLAQTESLFEIEKLKCLFRERSRTTGAGICSSRLMGAVADMVKQESLPGNEGEQFRFDAEEILGQKYQAKFCSSVVATMNPYRGKDIYSHMAQHFREVAFRMFFFRSLQRVLNNYDAEDNEDDTREEISSGLERSKVIRYDRSDDRSTISLRRFMQKLKIVRILSDAFENCVGFFRIPQVESFLDLASRHFSDQQITWLPTIIAEDSDIKIALPLLEQIGSDLVRLYNIHQSGGKRRDTGVRVRAPPQASVSSSILAVKRPVTPLIQEFLRFIEVSSQSTSISARSQIDLRPDEIQYQEKLIADRETFLCFREHNETYRRILASLKPETCKDHPLFLARWMMWRVYLWGLHALQDAVGDEISCARDIFTRQEELSRIGGAIVVSTYGSQFRPPMDLESMEMIWNHGVNIWQKWRNNLPIPFNEAHEAVKAKVAPIYFSGYLSQILLYGDLARLAIIVSPTESELAALIFKAKGGAMRGLDILGFPQYETAVAKAIGSLRDTLNSRLPETVKAMFHGSEASIFDVEHALCKVARKQNVRATMSPNWRTNTASENKRKGKDSEERGSAWKGPKKPKLT